MVLVVTFETDNLTKSDIVNTLKDNRIWLVFKEVYCVGFKVHFYIEHRFINKIQDLFSDKVNNLTFKVSRFQKVKGSYKLSKNLFKK